MSEFVENKEDLRAQIEGMAEKYQGEQEIVAWLRRKHEGTLP
jgi:cell division septum initiation protein DivIVA